MNEPKDRPQAGPCRHCGGDHQDEACTSEEEDDGLDKELR